MNGANAKMTRRPTTEVGDIMEAVKLKHASRYVQLLFVKHRRHSSLLLLAT